MKHTGVCSSCGRKLYINTKNLCKRCNINFSMDEAEEQED